MFYSFEKFEKDINEIAPILKGQNFNTIICPLRGAMSIAQKLSYKLDIKNIITVHISRVKFTDEDEYDSVLQSEIPDLSDYKPLIIDDISDSGVTLNLLKRHIPNAIVYTCFWNPDSSFKPDYYSNEVNEWVDFWWEK